ncbi:helix-turn-helix domain-containing protein [Vibrio sp. CAU 1672]|uniref:AraC family transcriptional regulator n=1 Tax=Vibrio sp. CAU 1672 TaxID=3032594 RepID=UPI0023DBBBDB|nr:helix-turn-helix domain-containing protein [Vibrio sp. CAU 1672]MDF2155350.1 AraC family transcriptional regulator ligand-binding domain-containing protein [Vibrio sp. CAU 1672]
MIRFIRALGIVNVHRNARAHYQLPEGALGIPDSVFHNPMNLIPMPELNKWYMKLEENSQDPDVYLNMSRHVELQQIGPIGRWLYSGEDLASTIRRVNYGMSNIQSGATLAGAQSGSIIKWTYANRFLDPSVNVHDSIRIAMLMLKVLREFLGADYAPLRVRLSGSRKNHELYTGYFGCEVDWNHSRTEVWLHGNDRLASRQANPPKAQRLAMNFSDLDELLNMPDPEDELKAIYEVFNYSRHFGLPSLGRVSGLLGLSEQQFQRRLHKFGMNFSTVLGYVLSNVAVQMLVNGKGIDEVAGLLGYTNTASFNRMFKRNRGLTPRQYLERHVH